MNASISPSGSGEIDLSRSVLRRSVSDLQRLHLDWIISIVVRDGASLDHSVEENALDCPDIFLADQGSGEQQ